MEVFTTGHGADERRQRRRRASRSNSQPSDQTKRFLAEIEYAFGCGQARHPASEVGEGNDEQRRHFRIKHVVSERGLRMDINDLRQEIANLNTLRGLLATRAVIRRDDLAGSLVRTAQAYYTAFCNGYRRNRSRVAIAEIAGRALDPVEPARQQTALIDPMAFVQSAIDPDMLAGPYCGSHVMIEQWERYTSFFNVRNFHMQTCQVIHVADRMVIVKTTGQYTMTFTEATLVGVFPHLRAHSEIARKLLGRSFTCQSAIDFFFDEQGRIVRYAEETDFLGGLASLVQNPIELAMVMGQALIGEESMVGVMDEPAAPENGDPC